MDPTVAADGYLCDMEDDATGRADQLPGEDILAKVFEAMAGDESTDDRHAWDRVSCDAFELGDDHQHLAPRYEGS